MSLLLQKSQKRLTLPENAEIMVAQSPELSMFLQDLERPIGIIKIGEEASHAVASEYSEQLRAIVTNLGRIAAQGNGLPVRHNENLVTSGNTEYGDEVVSVLSERKIGGAHLVDLSLIHI